MARPPVLSLLLPVAVAAVVATVQAQDPSLRFKVRYVCADNISIVVSRCETGDKGEFCFYTRFRGELDLGESYGRRPNVAMAVRNCKVEDAAPPAAAGGVRPAAGAPAAAGASTAKVESVVVAPYDVSITPRFAVSPVGQHVAAIVMSGSRTVVTLDGVAGPRFDEVLSSQGGEGLHFSPDGLRLAYIGRQGQEYVYMVDNKEMLRLPMAQYPQLSMASTATYVSAPQFSANSKHVYFALYSQEANGSDAWTVVVDGQRGPRSVAGVAPVFSSGDHYAYVADNRAGQNNLTLIVDGKPAGYAGLEPEFNADGSHLFTRNTVPGQNAVDLLMDGRRLIRGGSIRLYFPTSGPAFLGVVESTVSPFGSFLIDGAGRKVANSDCPGVPGIDGVFFNANGQHYAARCKTQGGAWLLVDGRRTQEYGVIAAIDFAPDGRVVFQGSSGGQSFVVVGDQESTGYSSFILTRTTMDPTAREADRVAQLRGTTVGFIGMTANSSNDTVVVNGRTVVRRLARNLTLSPDGSRFAFSWERGGAGPAVNVDGVDDAGGRTEPFFLARTDGYGAPQSTVLFSPDGRHVVHFGRQASQAAGIFVNGTFTQTGAGNVAAPIFTADSRHLYWVERVRNGGRMALFLNGKAVVQFDSSMMLMPNWIAVGSDGVLTALVIDGSEMKRLRVTPSADTSFDTLAGARAAGR